MISDLKLDEIEEKAGLGIYARYKKRLVFYWKTKKKSEKYIDL